MSQNGEKVDPFPANWPRGWKTGNSIAQSSQRDNKPGVMAVNLSTNTQTQIQKYPNKRNKYTNANVQMQNNQNIAQSFQWDDKLEVIAVKSKVSPSQRKMIKEELKQHD